MRIIANKSILHNNLTGCTFVASELDEHVQTGTRENDSHIEWMGDLTIPVYSTDPSAGKEVNDYEAGSLARNLIQNITVNTGNASHLAQTGKISGSLLIDLIDAFNKYQQQFKSSPVSTVKMITDGDIAKYCNNYIYGNIRPNWKQERTVLLHDSMIKAIEWYREQLINNYGS